MADERVRILLEARDNASATINKVGTSLDNMKPSAAGLTGSFGKLLPVLGAIGGAFAAVGGASAAMDLAATGAKAEALGASFDMLAQAAGQSSDEMLAAMQRASGGTIANTDLILAANRAMSFGVANSGQEMASLIQLSMAQAAKMGITATQAFNDLVTGVGRLSPMILDNLGVTVSAEKAYATYAAALGKTADALTQAEQRQAFLNEMMASAPNAANEAGIAAGGFQRMDAAMANLTTATGAFLSGPGGEFADWVATVANGAAGFLNPSDTQKTNAAIADTSRLIADLERQIAAVNGEFVNLGQVAGEAMPTDITMPAPLMTEQDAIVISEAAVNIDELNRQLQALITLRNTLQSAGDPLAITGQGQASLWLEQQQEIAAQAATTAQAIIDANNAIIASTQAGASVQIDTLTKGLISDIGANAALQLNEELKAQLIELIALYQQMGMPADLINYNVIDWLNNVAAAEKEAARAAQTAAGSLNTYARSAGNAATASARSIGPMRAMAGALRDVAMAAGGSGTGRMDKWERLNYDLTGMTPKANAMKDGMTALGAAFDDASFSVGGFGSAVADSFDDGIAGKVSSLLSGALDVGVGPDPSSLLPREDALNEDARRLADVMVNGFSSPWAAYFQSEFPALFQQMTAGGDIKAGAASMLQEFEQGLRPELINQDMVKERVKAMLVGDANMAALAQEITAELQAEMAGMDPAQISAAVGGALGIGETGVGAGIEDELGNAALIGKIQGTGTTAGKSWGNAFLAYVQDNVPATLVGLLVDLVTPGVRAKITADASAEGAA